MTAPSNRFMFQIDSFLRTRARHPEFYMALVQVFLKESKPEAKALIRGLCEEIRSHEFTFLLNCCCDILQHYKPVTKALQYEYILVSEIQNRIDHPVRNMDAEKNVEAELDMVKKGMWLYDRETKKTAERESF